MNPLVTEISKKIGVPEDKARQVVLLTAHYLKQKLPAPLGTEIDALLNLGDITEEESRLIGVFKVP